jgi:predicted ArsR family transcriptional regulator
MPSHSGSLQNETHSVQQSNKDRILYLLKTRGRLTATVLAGLLDMTMMGARQLLLELEQQRLVTSEKKAQGRGRPKLFWMLTDKGHGRFPDRHSDLTLNLIDNITQTFGDEGLERLILAREEQALADYQARLKGLTLKQKLEQLAAMRSQEGYMAEVKKQNDGSYLLIENHCPICAAAELCQGFCRSELSIFGRCLEASVERVEYMLEGARRCAYKITP